MTKSFWRRWPIRKKIILVLTGLLSIIILYFLISLLLISPGEVKLARLHRSFVKDSYCHEACSIRRGQLEKEIVEILQRDKKRDKPSRAARRLDKRLEAYFTSHWTGSSFRLEIIRIYALAQMSEAVPLFLVDYFNQADSEAVVRAGMIRYFDPLALENGLDLSATSALEAYFKLLEQNPAPEVQTEIIRQISLQADKDKFFSAEQLAVMEKIIFSAAYPRPARYDLISLLSDYYLFAPDPTEKILEKIYYSDTLDNISRLLAADILNRFRADQLAEPEVSQAQWAEYYKQ
jgi:hypothetical protein